MDPSRRKSFTGKLVTGGASFADGIYCRRVK
jgi:hypothetical protein